MSPNQPSPTPKVAILRIPAPADRSSPLLPASLHALITAILTRLFTRLEHLLQLWQAGNLPIPQPRPRTARANSPRIAGERHESAPRAAPFPPHPRRRTMAAPPCASHAPSFSARPAAPAWRHPRHTPGISPFATPTARPPPHSARAPPSTHPPIGFATPHAGPHRHDINVAIS